MRVFVVIPAFNEEQSIGSVLAELKNLPYEVVVINDASSDQTAKIVEQFPVVLLSHRLNRGQGAALQTGNDYALKMGADIIVHFDADGQFLVKEISEIIAPLLTQQYDIVFGSRFLDKKSELPWLKDKLIFPIARLINRLFLGIKLTDPQSGFRAMTKETAAKIIIEHDGAAHCSEIAAKAHKLKLRIKEVPMTVKYFSFGQSLLAGKGRGQGGLQIIKDLLFNKLSK